MLYLIRQSGTTDKGKLAVMLGRKATVPRKREAALPKSSASGYILRCALGFFDAPWLVAARAFILEGWPMESHATRNSRVVTFLNRAEIDFLDKLGKDALFSTGLKVSRTKLISWLIDFIKNLNINGENILSEKDLENRIKEIVQKSFPPATEK
jgi:hypothetical protein